MKTLLSLLSLLLAVKISPVLAQSTVMTYQGRVTTGGAGFTGPGQFKLALVTVTNTAAPASATASPPSGGFITLIAVTFGGSGYVTAPAVTISGGGGAGATATAAISGGVVTGITVNNPGGGYTSTPTVTVAPPPEALSYTTFWSNDGSSSAGSEPATFLATPVSNGLFTVRLGDSTLANMAALPSGLFHQPDLQLRVWFNDGVNGFAALSPTQPLSAAPYAFIAGGASNLLGSVTTDSLSGTYDNVLTLNNAGNSFSGSGAGLTALNASRLSAGTVPDARLAANLARTNQVWLLGGNSGTSAGTHFIGTTDNQPVEIRVNGQRALRLESNGNGGANVIGGAARNFISSGAIGATISGGGTTNYLGGVYTNAIRADLATISGGGGNSIGANATAAVLGGGINNLIETNCDYSTISGGVGNEIRRDSLWATVGGGVNNFILPTNYSSTIGGGNNNAIFDDNTGATISGGQRNRIQRGVGPATIAGGQDNEIRSTGYGSVIGGGENNSVSSASSFVGGGTDNRISFNCTASTIGGGGSCVILQNSSQGTIAGGGGNIIEVSAPSSTIGGGNNNAIKNNAGFATIAGGNNNTIYTNSGASTIGGGVGNVIQANAPYATIPGGNANSATNYAYAAGRLAWAVHTGAFVWGDSTASVLSSAAANSVTMRASGGYRLFSNAGATIGVSLAASGNAWAAVSDRNRKKDIEPLDGRAILDKLAGVPISKWHYDFESTNDTPHIGPMAQDFKAAFYPGRDDKTISTMEFDGVALAAIQGLNAKVEKENTALRAENAGLKARLERLERLLLDRE